MPPESPPENKREAARTLFRAALDRLWAKAPDLTEDEVQAMVLEEIQHVRAARQATEPSPAPRGVSPLPEFDDDDEGFAAAIPLL